MGDWTKNYSKMLYLEMGICDEDHFVENARRIAEQRNWSFEKRKGDMTLLEKLFSGNWDDDFLMVKPGEKIIPRNDDQILGSE